MNDEEEYIVVPAQSYNGLFNVPGQGLVAQITIDGVKHLFDTQGIQFRILQLRREGLPSEIEDKALQQLSIFEEIT